MCLPPGSLRLLLSLCFLGLCLYPFLETVKAYAEKLGVPSVCAYIDAMDKNNNTIELTELQRALILIDGADSATLKCLNMGINTRRTLLSERAVASLVVGQRVKFERKNCGMIEGTITKINKKSIKLSTQSLGNWKVHPSLLIAV